MRLKISISELVLVAFFILTLIYRRPKIKVIQTFLELVHMCNATHCRYMHKTQ